MEKYTAQTVQQHCIESDETNKQQRTMSFRAGNPINSYNYWQKNKTNKQTKNPASDLMCLTHLLVFPECSVHILTCAQTH